jgi:SAM-dependent methyltransferase
MARDRLWTDRTVAWYARALARSDYARRVLAVLDPALAECEDALDVGAGCGALALPLARRLRRVTALEPEPAMVRGLEEAARRAGLRNVAVIPAAWREAPVRPHDLVVCAHVGGLLRPPSPFLRQVDEVARRWVALVRDWQRGPRDDKFFYAELYPRLLGRPYAACCDAEDTVAALRDRGVEPDVTLVEYDAGQPFTDLGEACDFWMTYMGLSGAASRAYLEGFLRERLVREGDALVAPYRKTVAVIRWRMSALARATR